MGEVRAIRWNGLDVCNFMMSLWRRGEVSERGERQ